MDVMLSSGKEGRREEKKEFKRQGRTAGDGEKEKNRTVF